jgi:hypothetical protein
MPTIIPVAYNTGSPISGTLQVGDIAVGNTNQDYSGLGGLQWWASTDLDQGFAIITPNPAGDTPNPLSIPCFLSFWNTDTNPAAGTNFTVRGFTELASYIKNTQFTNYQTAYDTLTNDGIWTNFDPNTPLGLFEIENQIAGVSILSPLFGWGSGDQTTPNEGSIPLATGGSIVYYTPDKVNSYSYGFTATWTGGASKTIQYETYVDGVLTSTTSSTTTFVSYQNATVYNKTQNIRVVLTNI